MPRFDIAPFALPNSPAGEYWFEEARDLEEVVVRCRGQAAGRLEVEYLRRRWPELRVEARRDLENPAAFGWVATDDWFNGSWQRARVRRTVTGSTLSLRFAPLSAEKLTEIPAGYDPRFRRTMAVRLSGPGWSRVTGVRLHTCSRPVRRRLRVELDAGRRTSGKGLALAGYNARVRQIRPLAGVRLADDALQLRSARSRSFLVEVDCMEPAHPYAGDAGLLEFHLDHDFFTVSLESLAGQGPVWFAEEGVYLAAAEDPTTFAEYQRRHAGVRTVNQLVMSRPEHSLARAMLGQPRPHPVAYSFGCKHSPQRYWLEPNGDLLLHRANLTWLEQPGPAAARYLNQGNARFFFGLEHWTAISRQAEPPPVNGYRLGLRQGSLFLEEQTVAVPLTRSILDGEPGFDAVTVALLRFRFENRGEAPEPASLSMHYSEDSRRHHHALDGDPRQSDLLVPVSPLVSLTEQNGLLTSQHQDRQVVRALAQTSMTLAVRDGVVSATQLLQPGESCELLLKVPYVALDAAGELANLAGLDFDRALAEVSRFWREENRRGSRLHTPVPQLDTLYASHLTHVEITDFSMPDDPDLLNTSVGTSTYGNFSNESCMIVQELDQRGLAEEVRRRLDLWVKYQGTKPQPGNFTDYRGMYYGAGGFEQGSYNQHHGWVLWALAEHFLLTGDRDWFGRVAASVVAGADWIFRQRQGTLADLPHSRGWERGFLPAGSLEDVTEFYYWLSTNCVTWRGADRAAASLETFGHPEASRVRAEADAYRADLIAGFETMRRHAPLVRLRDGCWVPHYPSRLYCRGRDTGWIREVLEGAVYLLISGLYDPRSPQAAWILDDYQDNLYLTPPYGYVLRDPEVTRYSRGGFSIQPCLLAGLLPHLQRDEPEVYLWMLFNAVAAIYREEINGMIEHPLPELGFSNSVTFKTSDEANAVMWVRYLLVYWEPELLHLGRALPRVWLAQESPVAITGVRTPFGLISVEYRPEPSRRRVTAIVSLDEGPAVPRALVRFRLPERGAFRSVRVAGRAWSQWSGEDVEVTGLNGTQEIEVEY
ncbi:MAG: hypothetical protein WDA75_17355 [Candidatus Latescibacterota bacterium]|jgi:hypothetical protein